MEKVKFKTPTPLAGGYKYVVDSSMYVPEERQQWVTFTLAYPPDKFPVIKNRIEKSMALRIPWETARIGYVHLVFITPEDCVDVRHVNQRILICNRSHGKASWRNIKPVNLTSKSVKRVTEVYENAMNYVFGEIG